MTLELLDAGSAWAGHRRYATRGLVRPASHAELADVVTSGEPVRVLGSRHSFNDLADSPGVLVSLDALVGEPVIDEARRTVTVDGAMRYGELAAFLHAHGWALHAMASLPHISVAGAIATATHGSGDTVTNLAGAVVGLDLLTADGRLHTLGTGDGDLAGAVVSLGALGVVTSVTMRIEPTYDVAQVVWEGLGWDVLTAEFDTLSSSATSVSVFTTWRDDVAGAVWQKHRTDAAPARDLADLSVRRATTPHHPIPGVDAAACTQQLGVPGPWHDRLPHFRLEFTPSAGAELQSEYLLPREHLPAAITALRSLADDLRRLVLVTEVRTVAADELWLSSAYGRDTVGLHFTWVQDVPAVEALLPRLEAALDGLDARPHWGKLFAADAATLAARYSRWDDARALIRRYDPDGVFANPYLQRVGLR
ncbi:FAD linked oxidase domain protein [Beutenbergia cavernae DSM 12333]|uniref:FAD linked oxidase domain protein n=1 Tax=Beutenbergia cavernae (strain ATCC BAA-8 / DSM 12333 / CCUG 43141 / JCM 11478 / NBRC 16432 / NCIMB 13614 / HKI 0122) TaxID=471853 RepID=C5BZ09_BEUC1|nr:D-arabinono-1,4-lactone oxidase [Beutenbergia cavernae]ACQ81124.1 FAD linked oxidase domain protein [Beutenbergia cavernae DSM 12333]